jgi:molybdopterin/thiamine biosynthesis adenylyltransferase
VSTNTCDVDRCNAQVFDTDDPGDRRILEGLRAMAGVAFIDHADEQMAEVTRLRSRPAPDLRTEPKRWAYYPWRRAVVSVLGPRAFRAVRLDRNRNLITTEEQERLGELRIGVIGLSVGHTIAHTLAMEGLCAELRLADFDGLELSNLNRVPASVFDLGVNKATVTARRIAELDPYLAVRVWPTGVTPDTIGAFLDGVDIVVEECDSLDVKLLVRDAARARRLPVLMATSDRGLIDVERFDLEPSRPIMHGLLGDVDIAGLAGLPNRDKIPYVLRILDAAQLSPRGAASLIEVGHTLSTWPQRAGDAALGATLVAEAVRRIGLGEPLASGRVRVDVATALKDLGEPPRPHQPQRRAAPQVAEPIDPRPSDIVHIVAAAAVRAPSGGNAQPWRVETEEDSVTVALAPEYTSTMDVGFRASAVAVGAAIFNARVAAAAHGYRGIPTLHTDDSDSPLRGVVRLSRGCDAELTGLYRPMLRRETNRNYGSARDIEAEILRLLEKVVLREGAQIELLTVRDEIDEAASILAEADRIRYLTPRLHAEMVSELRWPGDPSADSGIDVRSLELDPGSLHTLELLRRPDVMAELADWDAGEALAVATRARVSASSGLAVVCVRGQTSADYARGGSAAEAAWIIAQASGLAVQPISPAFLYAHNLDDLRELSPAYALCLRDLQSDFRTLARTGTDESQVLVLRLSHAGPTTVRSRRRRLAPSGQR